MILVMEPRFVSCPIDSDVANDPDSTANTAVPAEFAGVLAADRFIGSAGLNRNDWRRPMDVTKIPFNAFLGIERCEPTEESLLALQDSPRYANHVNTVHAGAQFTLGEAASGEYLLRRFADLAEKETLVPLVRRCEVKYKKPAYGTIKASASMEDNVVSQTLVALKEKGRAIIPVSVNVIDSHGNTTMTAVYEWFVQRISDST
jgi:hypothetical protein